MGKGFANSSRIVIFFKRKYQWVVGQDFHWNFLVKVTRFFASFSNLFDWIALIWAWLERSHLPAQVSCQSCLGPLKLMTSQVVQGTWLNKGGYGRFRGQCVKVWVRSRCFFPISFGSFSGILFWSLSDWEVCPSGRRGKQQQIDCFLHDQQDKHALKQPLAVWKRQSYFQ